MYPRLIDTLARVHKSTETWTSTDGSRVVVLPYGGRILGLFAPGSDSNFFWTNSALDSIVTAGVFYQSEEWLNSGGDRTWLSPEVDFFFPCFPKLDTYRVPSELDPGNYQVSNEGGGIALSSRATLWSSRTRRAVDLIISKRLAPSLNPLRHLDPKLSNKLGYAGYTLNIHLAFSSGEIEPDHVGLWSLLQLPHGGDLLIPTFSMATIQMYMGEIAADDLLAEEHLIRYRMRATGQQKFGIQAPVAIGRMGYLYSVGNEICLVIRNFSTNPSGEYVDVPWAEPDNTASVIQACNINSYLGQYSELEYHTPAIGGPGGKVTCEDESQLWAFCGEKEHVLAAARILISPGA